MELYNGLPLIRLGIDNEEDGVKIISLVENPAVERNFIQLSKQYNTKLQLNEEKQELLGVALIPDFPIYRVGNMGEYYITFSKEAIRKTAINFYKDLNLNKADIEHSHNLVSGITYFQSFLIDSKRGIKPSEFKDLPDGSWIVGCKVENPQIWAKIKSGEVKGFSIDGYFSQEVEMKKEIDTIGDLFEWIENLK